MKVNIECRYFKGDKPCIFHKQEGAICKCRHYHSVGYKILIIKSGGIGDVLRSTPILRRLKQEYPDSSITWITNYPQALPSLVDNPLEFNAKNILILQAQRFDFLLNLDKELESCALCRMIKADKKKGFTITDGKCAPIDKDSLFKFQMGINDGLSKRCKKSYPEQVFNIAGYVFEKEKYVLDFKFDKDKKLIGLNTGCGQRWRSRLWSEQKWVDLAALLKKNNFEVLLLGGEAEHERNLYIAEASGSLYFGYHPLKDFISLVGFCDGIVTTVTMALHIAIALGKRVVVLNNVFNKVEFELYGLGKIIEPKVDCLGCYRDNCRKQCLETIDSDDVFKAISGLI